MRVLVTGSSGFVGRYLCEALSAAPSVEVISTSRADVSGLEPGIVSLDIDNFESVRAALRKYRPSHVVNLAAIASASDARADPDGAWRTHVFGTLNLANAILTDAPQCCLIQVGSGLVYGDADCPQFGYHEGSPLAPADDYAVTKAAADLALGALVRRGLRVLRMRPFNHTGAGQSEAFVVPHFAGQIARIEAGLSEPTMRVGNLLAERDFLDVRDVVSCYVRSIELSDSLDQGAIFNVASGAPRRIGDILDALLEMSEIPVRIEQDPLRVRPDEVMRIVGDASRASTTMGWRPKVAFDDTLADVLASARQKVSRSGAC
ncbi:GDP-mannose 4,6-dehydratase [Vitreimonas flagellata]|uniref:GDP-mannose 4,6-dehydratase n=1 Tax=Vitreimonas flagellata TaxID=2560861 RepID=UPI001074C46F|nr:GDP-mannose 4,6-dehydratase [Vitreimonas flagellata]